MRFDHVGVVVRTLQEGRKSLFWVTRWTAQIEDPGHGVRVQFGHAADGMCYELIAPLTRDSPVSNALRQRTNILNHTAYLVPDLGLAAVTLEAQRFKAVTFQRPAVTYDGALVQFFVAPSGLVVELIEAEGHQHAFA